MPIIFGNNGKSFISSPIFEEERPERKPQHKIAKFEASKPEITQHSVITKKQKEFLESLGYIVQNGRFKHFRSSETRR